MNPSRRVPPRLTRSVRVPTPGVYARVDYVDGELVNVSATGALVRMNRDLPVGGKCPVILDVEVRRIDLSGRVVRCQATGIELPGGAVLKRPVYALGVIFTYVSAAAMQGIVQLCGGGLSVEELPYRILVVGDDVKLNGVVSSTLTDAGSLVRVVTDARRVLSAAKESPTDAVIADLRLEREPSMWWVLEVLETDPATAGTPLAVLAESASLTPDRRRYLAERRVRLLTQPFTPEELVSVLRGALADDRSSSSAGHRS